MTLSLGELTVLAREKAAHPKHERALASSEAVERQTKPCMSTDAFKQLACVLYCLHVLCLGGMCLCRPAVLCPVY